MDEQTQATIPPKATPMASPGAPRPITVCLKPIAAQPATDGTDSPVSSSAADAATVRLRPVAPPPSMTAQVVPPVATTSPAQVAASVQAAKSKTSRISLDSAIGVATSIPITPQENVAPKTIRLKRPTDLAAPGTPAQVPITPMSFKSATVAVIPPTPATRTASSTTSIKTPATSVRQTSRIPDSVIPTEAPVAPAPAPATVDSTTVTQKKTLKIRRPGAPEAVTVTAESAEGSDGVQMTPISEIEAYGAPVSKGYKAFTVTSIIFASAAAILMIVLNWCLAADVVAPLADKNAASSIPINMEVSWPGKFIQ